MKKEKKTEWNLILVNREHYMPEDFEIELTGLSNGECVDSRIYPYLKEMFSAAESDGLGMYLGWGYRSAKVQQLLFDIKLQECLNEGCSEPEAKKITEQWVALPGTSEHQLGLAVDIDADTSKATSSEIYGWLAVNAHKYGFILRYPSSKKEITRMNHEPWHYRYVGTDAAAKIFEQGLCLEEYIDEPSGG